MTLNTFMDGGSTASLGNQKKIIFEPHGTRKIRRTPLEVHYLALANPKFAITLLTPLYHKKRKSTNSSLQNTGQFECVHHTLPSLLNHTFAMITCYSFCT